MEASSEGGQAPEGAVAPSRSKVLPAAWDDYPLFHSSRYHVMLCYVMLCYVMLCYVVCSV
jgi:hypothetical protein